MKINTIQFNKIYNNILLKIENILDNYSNHYDIDYEINYSIMTISFSKTNKIIITKQEIYKQIWLANKINGYHFNYNGKEWICNRSNKNFWEILQNSFHKANYTKIIFV